MSTKQHPVPATLDAFQKVFNAIVELAAIGRINLVEDALLVRIVDQLHELYEQFGEREYLIMSAGQREELSPENKDLKHRLQTRLLMQTKTNLGSELSELAGSELLENLGEEEAN